MAQLDSLDIQRKKERIKEIASLACDYSFIDSDYKESIEKKLENDILTIGVIGQMKAGKSTFLNAFVFEEDLLPSATTPMTAALSVITYGEEKGIKAEFYSLDEWEEQKLLSSRSTDGLSDSERSRIEAAKELVEKSSKLGNLLGDLLNKTKEDSFENLIEYVGADGKYVSITKSVTIFYPAEYLKGVEIVDTPGFNDPIVSREERTKDFLKKADAVLLLIYAGQPFSAVDRDILFKNVKQCGTGRVLIGINKYDLPYANGETESEIISYVKNEIKKASQEYDDKSLLDIISETEPIAISANMALLSQLSMSKIKSSEVYLKAYEMACENFEISSQSELLEKSHISKLTSAVKDVLEKEKYKILFTKPLKAMQAGAEALLEKKNKEIYTLNATIKMLSSGDIDVEQKRDELEHAKRRLDKKIDSLRYDMDDEYKTLIRRAKQSLEEEFDKVIKNSNSIVEKKKWYNSGEHVAQNVQDGLDRFTNRTVRHLLENLTYDIETKTRSTLTVFFDSVEEIFIKYIDDDSESIDMIKKICHSIQFQADEIKKVEINSWQSKKVLFAEIRSIKDTFDIDTIVNDLMSQKDSAIEKIRISIIEEIIDPLSAQLDDIVKNISNKEQKLADTKNNVSKLIEELRVIEERKKEIELKIDEII